MDSTQAGGHAGFVYPAEEFVMGDPACWLDRVCRDCGLVAEHLDADGSCAACTNDRGPAPGAPDRR